MSKEASRASPKASAVSPAPNPSQRVGRNCRNIRSCANAICAPPMRWLPPRTILKTPLAILNGYVELLQSEKLGDLNERQREVLRDMHSNGQRLQHYIQDFLSFSVLETGELKMQFEPGNINACLSEVCRLWSPRFQEKGLALYFLANEKVHEFRF